MKKFDILMAALIRQGEIAVSAPNLDIDKLAESLNKDMNYLLFQIASIVEGKEMSDQEKISRLKRLLREY